MSAPTYIRGPIEVTGTSKYAVNTTNTSGVSTDITDFSEFFSYKHKTATDFKVSMTFKASAVSTKQLLIFNGQSITNAPNMTSVYNNLVNKETTTSAGTWDGWFLWIDSDNHPVLSFTKNTNYGMSLTSKHTGSLVGWNDYVKFSNITISANTEYALSIECTAVGTFKATCGSVTQTQQFSDASNRKASLSDNEKKLSACGICNTRIFGSKLETKFVAGGDNIYIKSFSITGSKAGGAANSQAVTGTTKDYRESYPISVKTTVNFNASSYVDSRRNNISILNTDSKHQTYSQGGTGFTMSTDGTYDDFSSFKYVANFAAAMLKVGKNNGAATAAAPASNNYWKQVNTTDFWYRFFLNDPVNNESIVWPTFSDSAKTQNGFNVSASATSPVSGWASKKIRDFTTGTGAEYQMYTVWISYKVMGKPNKTFTYTYNGSAQGYATAFGPSGDGWKAYYTNPDSYSYSYFVNTTTCNIEYTVSSSISSAAWISQCKATYPGDYTIKITPKAGYAWSTTGDVSAVTLTSHITKASIAITPPNNSKTYDGSPLSGSNTYTSSGPEGLKGSDTLTVGWVTDGELTGTYSVLYGTSATGLKIKRTVTWSSAIAKLCYLDPVISTPAYTINQRNITISIPTTGNTKTYDGLVLSVTPTITSGSIVSGDTASYTVSSIGPNVGSSSVTPNTPVIKRGSKNVTSCYNITKQNGTLSITARPITISVANSSKVYDGTVYAASSSVTSGTLASGDELSPINVSTPSANVGTYSVSTSGEVIKRGSTTVTSNYNITRVAGTLTITKRPVVFTTPSASFVYSEDQWGMAGITVSKVSGNDNSGLVSGHKLTYYNIGDYYPAAAANTYWPSKIQVQTWDNTPKPDLLNSIQVLDLSSTNVYSNYDVTWVYGHLEITKRPLTVSFGTASKVYDGTPLSVTASLTNGTLAKGLVGTDTVLAEATAVTPSKDAGTYTISSSGLTITDGTDTGRARNYNITYSLNTLKITQRPLTVTWSKPYSKQYDGTVLKIEPTLGNVVEGELVEPIWAPHEIGPAVTSTTAVLSDLTGGTKVLTNNYFSYEAGELYDDILFQIPYSTGGITSWIDEEKTEFIVNSIDPANNLANITIKTTLVNAHNKSWDGYKKGLPIAWADFRMNTGEWIRVAKCNPDAEIVVPPYTADLPCTITENLDGSYRVELRPLNNIIYVEVATTGTPTSGSLPLPGTYYFSETYSNALNGTSNGIRETTRGALENNVITVNNAITINDGTGDGAPCRVEFEVTKFSPEFSTADVSVKIYTDTNAAHNWNGLGYGTPEGKSSIGYLVDTNGSLSSTNIADYPYVVNQMQEFVTYDLTQPGPLVYKDRPVTVTDNGDGTYTVNLGKFINTGSFLNKSGGVNLHILENSTHGYDGQPHASGVYEYSNNNDVILSNVKFGSTSNTSNYKFPTHGLTQDYEIIDTIPRPIITPDEYMYTGSQITAKTINYPNTGKINIASGSLTELNVNNYTVDFSLSDTSSSSWSKALVIDTTVEKNTPIPTLEFTELIVGDTYTFDFADSPIHSGTVQTLVGLPTVVIRPSGPRVWLQQQANGDLVVVGDFTETYDFKLTTNKYTGRVRRNWKITEGYKVHAWHDNAWHDYFPYIWDGSNWKQTRPYYWNGYAWVECGR